MGKTYRELKNKLEQLRFENSFLTSKVEKVLLENGKLKRELHVSNARIVELAQEIELLKNGLPFAGEGKEVLEGFSVFDDLVSLGYMEDLKPTEKNRISSLHSSSDADRELELFARANPTKKEEKAFSSRFMPNVKFKIPMELENSFVQFYYYTNKAGDSYYPSSSQKAYMTNGNKEVSIYEAIPELVPDGMVYDKESDSLVKKS